MSYDVALARIAQLQSLFVAPAAAAPAAPKAPAATSSTSAPTAFATALQSAGTSTLAPTVAQQPASSAGQAIVTLVSQEVGVKEQPPGSNDSPRIAQFRQATAGSGVGPWCAYFTSWAAREA